MNHSDTVKLLQECDAGTKMAISSIDEVLDHVQDSELKNLLSDNKQSHSELQNELDTLLAKMQEEKKDPATLAKGMSWIKTNYKLSMNDSDNTIADLITDGCNMGVKSLNKYLNQYSSADEKSSSICKKLITLEEDLGKNLRKYL